jgi:RES domain-containing protein
MHLRSYTGRVYRNFATIIESQELTDDLTEDPANREILKGFFYSSEEKRLKSPVERVLEKSEDQIVQEEIDCRFQPSKWRVSRYSDGTWGVLYAAESEETALREALFHMMKFYREELRSGPLHVQRRVLSLQAKSEQAVDLTREEGLNREALVSLDESGYPYCQGLAREAMDSNAQLLRAPSARHKGGHCTPIFDQAAVARDEGHLKYLRCLLKEDGSAEVISLIEEETKVYLMV